MWVQKKDKEQKGDTVTWHVTYLLMYKEVAFKIPFSLLPASVNGSGCWCRPCKVIWSDVRLVKHEGRRKGLRCGKSCLTLCMRIGGRLEFISERTRRLGFHFSDQRRHFSPSHRLWSSFRISKVISKGSLKGFFVSARLPLNWLKWKGARPGSAGHCCWIVFDVSAFTSKEAAPCPCSDTAGASARLSCTVVRIRTKHSMTQRKE